MNELSYQIIASLFALVFITFIVLLWKLIRYRNIKSKIILKGDGENYTIISFFLKKEKTFNLIRINSKIKHYKIVTIIFGFILLFIFLISIGIQYAK